MIFPGRAWVALVLAWVVASAGPALAFDWNQAREDSVVEILTSDADGSLRETPVWIVVIGEAAYVRTNGSKWLANIRRGSAVRLRIREIESAVRASEMTDPGVSAKVEEAFLAKYGLTQRVMSLLRFRDPTVLRLTPEL
jgi:hypothetical protein